MILETKHLILRKPEMKDVDDYMEFVNTEFVNRYNAMSPTTWEKAQSQFANAGDDLGIVAMELKNTGKVIGMIYTGEDSLRYGVASKEFSYFLREEVARKGYMKEALRALIDYFFTEEKLDCVSARCFVPNVASQRLLESLGFTRDGVVRKCVRGYQDRVFDDCLYSLMREDWKN
ncbi:MAG: GNAT family N-acetyltransferase [Oscillospiraceae bacterium]|nr:GNAT family N-acetyltransferase [Oscillospiraceae bacterium]